jgi:hypothetical protein
MPPQATPQDAARVLVLEHTQRWLERLVIGLRLCPFASEPYEAGTVRFRVSEAESPDLLCRDLAEELQLLMSAPRESIETTLLIHPFTLGDFPCFNDFLDIADACLRSMNLEGVIQIASFHPNYRFAGTEDGEVSNATNRSPYPMLHLLREESVAEALEHFEGDPGQIPRRNVRVLTELGWEGVRARSGTGRSS